MKLLPILMSAPMVHTILENRKRMTRRLKPYKKGQILWVKETFQFVQANSDGQRGTFKSSVPFTIHDYRWIEYAATTKDEPAIKWKPSIFMPRWASRITLEVLSDSRPERLQDISEADAIAEGIHELPLQEGLPGAWWTGSDKSGRELHSQDPVIAFRLLWEQINGKGSWHQNPIVYVTEFKRI